MLNVCVLNTTLYVVIFYMHGIEIPKNDENDDNNMYTLVILIILSSFEEGILMTLLTPIYSKVLGKNTYVYGCKEMVKSLASASFFYFHSLFTVNNSMIFIVILFVVGITSILAVRTRL